MFGFGIWEVLVVLAIVMLLFANRLPSLARSIGRSIPEFKKGIGESKDQPADDLEHKK
jgi:sec-independent protein translocase protein TatA